MKNKKLKTTVNKRIWSILANFKEVTLTVSIRYKSRIICFCWGMAKEGEDKLLAEFSQKHLYEMLGKVVCHEPAALEEINAHFARVMNRIDDLQNRLN